MSEVNTFVIKTITREPDDGFRKLDGQRTPTVSSSMIAAFIAKHSLAQTLDNKLLGQRFQIDFVQIGLDAYNQNTILNAEVLDRKCTSKACTSVSLMMVESLQQISEVSCSSCDKVCGHSIAFMFWLHRRSALPAEQQTASWGQALSDELACKKLIDICPATPYTVHQPNVDPQVFVNEVLRTLKTNHVVDNRFYQHHCPEIVPFESLLLRHIFQNNSIDNYKSCIMYLEKQTTKQICNEIHSQTVDRYKSGQWMRLQYGRIRCSIVHNVNSWTEGTKPEIIDECIRGMYRIDNDPDRVRQKLFKRKMLSLISNIIDEPIEPCGLIINPKYPQFCVSPDGLSKNYAIEVKFPSCNERSADYLLDNTLPPKYYAQVQMQMIVSNRKQMIYCVLDPEVLQSGNVFHQLIQFDAAFADKLMSNCEDVWKSRVYPTLNDSLAINCSL